MDTPTTAGKDLTIQPCLGPRMLSGSHLLAHLGHNQVSGRQVITHLLQNLLAVQIHLVLNQVLPFLVALPLECLEPPNLLHLWGLHQFLVHHPHLHLELLLPLLAVHHQHLGVHQYSVKSQLLAALVQAVLKQVLSAARFNNHSRHLGVVYSAHLHLLVLQVNLHLVLRVLQHLVHQRPLLLVPQRVHQLLVHQVLQPLVLHLIQPLAVQAAHLV